MKKLSLLTLRISIFLMPLLLLVFAPTVQAQTQAWGGKCVGTSMSVNTVTNGATAQSGSVDASDVATIQGFQCLIANVLMITLTGLGMIGFVMFIVGAFMYMLSGGNAKGTESAKQTITYSIIGIVVALSAFIILNLISQFTGIESILNFAIPDSRNEYNCVPRPGQPCITEE